MRVPAEQFLTMRAFGAPPIVIALAAQGTFRGFKDTKTPLYAVGKYQRYPNTSLIYIKQRPLGSCPGILCLIFKFHKYYLWIVGR